MPTSAEENSNTVRAVIDAYILASNITAGVAGVTVNATASSTFTATSRGQGNRTALNDVRNDVAAYVEGSDIVTSGAISFAAEDSTVLNATSLLRNSDTTFIADALVYAMNVVNGDVEAYAENSGLTTIGTGDVSFEADDLAVINAIVSGGAISQATDVGIAPSLALGAGVALNAVGLDAGNVLLASFEDLLGDLNYDWLENIIPPADYSPARTRAYLLDSQIDAGGDLTLTASSSPQIDAFLDNAATASAQSVLVTYGGSLGVALSSNKIYNETDASIAWSDGYAGARRPSPSMAASRCRRPTRRRSFRPSTSMRRQKRTISERRSARTRLASAVRSPSMTCAVAPRHPSTRPC